MATPIPFGPEFLPAFTNGNQSRPAVTGLADGTMLVTWIEGVPGDDGADIVGQILGPDGEELGSSFFVNTITARNQLEPAVTALTGGGFAIVYSDNSRSVDDDSGTAIRLMVAGKVGPHPNTRIIDDVLVNSAINGDQFQPAVAGLTDGRFVVAWSDASAVGGPDNTLMEVKAQIFTATGARIGTEIRVNTTATNSQFDPAITPLAGGRFVVTWSDQSFTGADNRSEAIRGQVFAADGSKLGAEFVANSTTDNAQVEPAISALADGGFVILWTDFSTAINLNDIRGQRFTPEGAKLGPEFIANDQLTSGQRAPAVVGLPDGGFFVAWENESQTPGGDVSGTGIRARIFDAGGNATGPGVDVNTSREGNQTDPSVALMADGRVLVSWTDASESGGDTSGLAARMRLFDTVPGGQDLAGDAGADRIFGSRFNDRILGNGGNDTLFGGNGTDTLNGGTGDDFLFGGATDADLRDVIFGGEGNDRADGGAGNDEISGGNGNDVLVGGLGADTLIGNDGNDLLAGSGGSDLIFGNAGNDTLNGGFGFDRLNGGTGADSFLHQGVADHGSDWVQDYNAAEGDLLVMTLPGATASQFQVNIANTAGAGAAGVAEAFVIYRPTGQILWALVDGAGQSSINIQIGGQVFDLLA